MGHLLTEILLLLAAAALAGLGLGWALFHRAPAPSTIATPPDGRFARELEEARKALREADARVRDVESRAKEAGERSRGLEQALEAARAEARQLEERLAGPRPPAAEDPELSRLRAEVAELKAALAAHAAPASEPDEGDAGLRAELDQALSAQTRLEEAVAELEAERDRNRQMLVEQEATLDSLTRELTGRGRPASPATKVVGGPSPAKARTPTLSTMRAVAGKGATERLAAIARDDSSPGISVRPAGRTSTLSEGSPARAENTRPATVRQSRIDPSASRVAASRAPASPAPASEGLAPDEATVSVSLGDLVARIDAADQTSAPPDEATAALDVLSLVGRIDATTDAVEDDAPEEAAAASGGLPPFADASATIQQQRPSFLEGDDLKILKGVGPVTELRLREFGVQSWRGLADLDEAAVERLADHMKMTVERVRPWVEQARSLAATDPNPTGETA
jgi:predicted flap endonuclease-1-like 5' DNA nuclease